MAGELDVFLADVGKMIAEKKEERSIAEARDWAEMKTWTVDEWLLLISGINPKGLEIQWRGGGLGGVHLRNAWPLSESVTFLIIPAPTIRISDVKELPGGGLSATGEVDDDEQKHRKLAVLRNLEKVLDRARRLWAADRHDDQRYPANYFIEWAKSNGMHVNPYLERAVADRSEVVAVTGVTARNAHETPGERSIRFAKMRAAGMSGAEIAKVEGGSVSRANELCRKGEALLAKTAAKATSMCGQLAVQGVATTKPRTKAR